MAGYHKLSNSHSGEYDSRILKISELIYQLLRTQPVYKDRMLNKECEKYTL